MSSQERCVRLTPSPYEGLRELGQGGAGEVFLARSIEGELVAIKRLLGSSSEENAARLARFERERELLDRLRDVDGVVSLLGYGSDRFGPYLVLPYLPGGDLRQRIEKGEVDWEEIPALALRLAEILEGAHAAGVIHRDVKPENVLFDAQGEACLTDFGIGRSTRGLGDGANLTQSNQLLGTCDYMAPEQLMDPKNVRPTADVYSWAAVIYELYSGHRPFEGVTAAELLAALVSADVAPLRSLAADTPSAIADLVDRCLKREPGARPRDGYELADELRRALRAKPVASSRYGVAVALVALCFALGLVLMLVPRPPARPTSPTTVQPTAPEGQLAPATKLEPAIKARDPIAAGLNGKHLKLVEQRGGFRGRHFTMVSGLAVDVERGLVVTASLDGEVAAWLLESGDPVWIHRGDRGSAGVIRVDPVPGEPQVVLSGWKKPFFEVLDTRTGQRAARHQLDGREGGLYACPTRDGQMLVLQGTQIYCFKAGLTGTYSQVWAKELSAEAGLSQEPTGLIVKGDDFFVCSMSGGLGRFSVRSGELISSQRTVMGAHRLRWLGAGTVLAVLGDQGRFALFSPELKTLGEFFGLVGEARQGHIRDAIDISERYFLVAGDDMKVHIWDLERKERTRSLAVNHGESWVQGLAVVDGRRLVSTGNDGSVRLWDRESGRELWERDWAPVQPAKLSSSLNGRVMASTNGSSKVLGVWQEGKGWKSYQFDTPPQAAAVCEDPAQVAFYYQTAKGKRVIVMDLVTDKVIAGGAVEESLSATEWLADGRLLLMVQVHSGLRILEVQTGETLRGDLPLKPPIQLERLSPSQILASSGDGQVALVSRDGVSMNPKLSRGILESASRDGQSWLRLAVNGEVEAVSRYDIASGQPIGSATAVATQGRGLAVLPPYVLLLGPDDLEIRSFESGEVLETLHDGDFDQGLGVPISVTGWVTRDGRAQAALGMSKGPVVVVEAR